VEGYLPSDVILKKSYVLALTHCYHSYVVSLLLFFLTFPMHFFIVFQ
jgi:hypothetical protein